jgi:hypothetical protein
MSSISPRCRWYTLDSTQSSYTIGLAHLLSQRSQLTISYIGWSPAGRIWIELHGFSLHVHLRTADLEIVFNPKRYDASVHMNEAALKAGRLALENDKLSCLPQSGRFHCPVSRSLGT